jgi:hypothetical protein
LTFALRWADIASTVQRQHLCYLCIFFIGMQQIYFTGDVLCDVGSLLVVQQLMLVALDTCLKLKISASQDTPGRVQPLALLCGCSQTPFRRGVLAKAAVLISYIS